jgi:hypothetical protein
MLLGSLGPSLTASVAPTKIDVTPRPFKCATYDQEPSKCAIAFSFGKPCEHNSGKCRVVSPSREREMTMGVKLPLNGTPSVSMGSHAPPPPWAHQSAAVVDGASIWPQRPGDGVGCTATNEDATSLGSFSSSDAQAELRSAWQWHWDGHSRQGRHPSARARTSVLLIGDSTVRYQFLHLARAVLDVPPEFPLAHALTTGRFRGRFWSSATSPLNRFDPNSPPLPPAWVNVSDRGGSGDFHWNGVVWMVARSSANTTLAYVRVNNADFRRMHVEYMPSCDLLPRALHVAESLLLGAGVWPPHAVLWNLGLHLVSAFPTGSHQIPPDPIRQRQSPLDPADPTKSC